MTQEEYTLWTGESLSYSEEDWGRIVGVASGRLASFLCLDVLPTDAGDDLQMLLANFICAVLNFQGSNNTQVSSKSVRNFTIHFDTNSAANAFAQVASNYSDIVERYSDCGTGLDVESYHGHCF